MMMTLIFQSAHAADGIQFNATIANHRASGDLVVLGESLSWGRYNGVTPQNVRSGETKVAFYASGRSDSASGVEGWVQYGLASDHSQYFTIYFDVPWAPGAANTVTVVTSNPDILVTTEGFRGYGAVENVLFRVRF